MGFTTHQRFSATNPFPQLLYRKFQNHLLVIVSFIIHMMSGITFLIAPPKTTTLIHLQLPEFYIHLPICFLNICSVLLFQTNLSYSYQFPEPFCFSHPHFKLHSKLFFPYSQCFMFSRLSLNLFCQYQNMESPKKFTNGINL